MKKYVVSFIGSGGGRLTYGRRVFDFDEITASDIEDMEATIQAESDNEFDNLTVLGWSELRSKNKERESSD